MATLNVHACVLTALDEIAWLLNLRGFDIPFGVVFFAYALITRDGELKLFTDLARLTEPLRTSLSSQFDEPAKQLHLHNYAEFYSYFEAYVTREIVPHGRRVYLSSQTNHFVHSLVPVELVYKDLSIVAKTKIVKNPSEIAAAKQIHARDSATLVELFYKLDKQFESGMALRLDLIQIFSHFNPFDCRLDAGLLWRHRAHRVQCIRVP